MAYRSDASRPSWRCPEIAKPHSPGAIVVAGGDQHPFQFAGVRVGAKLSFAMNPSTKYAKSGNLNIAYQVVGDGDVDLVWTPGSVSHLDIMWEEPSFAHSFQRLASFSRVIRFDKRGTGLSDRVGGVPNLEERMDDIRAVMDAAGSERAAIVGISEGGPMSILFAATYPERTTALVLCGSIVCGEMAENPWWPTVTSDELRTALDEADFSSDDSLLSALAQLAPSVSHDPVVREWWLRHSRAAASPGAARTLVEMNALIDVRSILPLIRVPTLVLHVAGEQIVPVEIGRYLAQQVPGATYVELPGTDHITAWENGEAIAAEIQGFLTGVRPDPEPDRVLATVLFTDIVGSTEKAAALGDRSWHQLLDRHHAVIRKQLALFRGKEIDTAGDGFVATFDGPGRAVRCAGAITEAVRHLGIEVRTGLHTGEIELQDGGIAGIAVHIASRIAGRSGPGETLVSRTVVDLVTGSGIDFDDHGAVALKGVPGEWQLFAARGLSAC